MRRRTVSAVVAIVVVDEEPDSVPLPDIDTTIEEIEELSSIKPALARCAAATRMERSERKKVAR